jgi:CubicO group peptidase (beta-lactamase class C family)
VIREAATPYGVEGDALPHYRFAAKAAGGLYTTASDLARFVAAALPGPSGAPPGRGVLAPETVDEMLAPAPDATTRIGPITIYSRRLGYHIDPVLLGRTHGSSGTTAAIVGGKQLSWRCRPKRRGWRS